MIASTPEKLRRHSTARMARSTPETHTTFELEEELHICLTSMQPLQLRREAH